MSVSWALDVAFWEGIWAQPGTEAATILIFILPWRVVRIVNSESLSSPSLPLSLSLFCAVSRMIARLLCVVSRVLVTSVVSGVTRDCHVCCEQCHAWFSRLLCAVPRVILTSVMCSVTRYSHVCCVRCHT